MNLIINERVWIKEAYTRKVVHIVESMIEWTVDSFSFLIVKFNIYSQHNTCFRALSTNIFVITKTPTFNGSSQCECINECCAYSYIMLLVYSKNHFMNDSPYLWLSSMAIPNKTTNCTVRIVWRHFDILYFIHFLLVVWNLSGEKCAQGFHYKSW